MNAGLARFRDEHEVGERPPHIYAELVAGIERGITPSDDSGLRQTPRTGILKLMYCKFNGLSITKLRFRQHSVRWRGGRGTV